MAVLEILILWVGRRFGAIRLRNIGRANSLVGWLPAYYDRSAETAQARGRTMNTMGTAGSSAAAYMYVRLYPYIMLFIHALYIYVCVCVCV